MVFSSLEFLFRFLPVFFILYFVVRPKYRNVILLLGSLFFYAYGEPLYIILMLASILVNYCLAFKISGDKRKLWFLLSLFYNLGILFVFKYINFFTSMVNTAFGKDLIPEIALTLPLGISFYTFQILSYMIDVYKGECRPEKKFLKFACYVSMFPQLVAGPIVNYPEIRRDLSRKRFAQLKGIEKGVAFFIIGLAYKVLLANKIGILWNDVQTIGPYGINTATAWLGSLGFTMQIYFDFFGYSLMAIGLGMMTGFQLPDNFDNPYCARSVTDFWRRWHITLSRWFRKYVYIPLGGNRKGRARMVLNLFIVWLLTGLWHGAGWNFILWGMFTFLLLVIEKFCTLRFLEGKHWLTQICSRLYMLLIIPVSWTIFNITDLTLLKNYLSRMFCIPLKGSVLENSMANLARLFGNYWWLLLLCLLCCTPLPIKLFRRYGRYIWFKILLFVLFWLSIYQLAIGGSNPFLYFRF